MTKSIFSDLHRLVVEKLKKARKEVALGQNTVAKIMGKTQSYISKLESGQRRIDIVELKILARIYKKTIDYFLKEK